MASADEDRRLLVVSYHFPPDPSVGGLRWSGLTKYLSGHGWRSWVVTAAPQPAHAVAGVVVASCPRTPTLNDGYRWLRSGPRRDRPPSTPAATPDATGKPTRHSWFATLRFEAGVLLSLPDYARGWVLRAAWTTRRLIARERPSVVVSSGPPHSAHIAAWIATRFTNTPWYVDMRDPWAGPSTDAWRESVGCRSALARWFTSASERLVFGSATKIICNTREFAAVLAARYPDVKIEWVPNAVDHELVPPVETEPYPGLGIVHAGTIYGGREFGPLLAALRTFLDRHPDAAHDGTRLRIAGHVEEPYFGTLKRQIAELNLERHVEFMGVLPRSEALRVVGRSTLAIVLAQGQEFQVPAKLYETVAMGVQTVVLASAASAAGSEAARLGATTIDPHNALALALFLEQARRGGRSPARLAPETDYRQLAGRVSALLAPPVETAATLAH
jgi:glycosyltransferase involved in cell wall biosynthesis